MITTSVLDEIRRLLRENRLSQRGIARQVGVSRGTVNAIANGKHLGKSLRRPTDDSGFAPPGGLAVRCPGCGGKVQMPCLLCHLRQRRANPTVRSPAVAQPNPFERCCCRTIAAGRCG